MVLPLDRGYPGLGRTQPRKTGLKVWHRRTLLVFAAVALVVFVAAVTLFGAFDSYLIPSEAMKPTTSVGDRVFTRPTVSANHGDVVIYFSPMFDGPAIGRVIAVGGDTISAVEGRVVIDGIFLNEPYLLTEFETFALQETEVPGQHYFIMGDNRTNSADSRVFGPVSGDTLIAKAHFIGWPIGRITGL